jgi:hypothetical protein
VSLKLEVLVVVLRGVMVGVRLHGCKSVGGVVLWKFAMMQEFGCGLGGGGW